MTTRDMKRHEGESVAELQRLCRQLETRLRDQTRELQLLKARFERYETALRGSDVTVYTQDRDLRYISISNPMLGHSIEEIVGRTDDEIMPSQGRAAMIALKRTALASGEAKDGEISMSDGFGPRWIDLHVEPLRDQSGAVMGLSCAAVDITSRREGEAHLRLLLRELTHRSKNLLAVIQAMARQTARHVGSIDAFLDQFGARLQALASSHDLLVQESWHGASLYELIRAQLRVHVDRRDSQISIDGPPIVLKPEAAQSLALAIHELATNAGKYGALSVPEGHVEIVWRRLGEASDTPVELVWHELRGPPVVPPLRMGFGRLVIERNLARSLDAVVQLEFPPQGVTCRIVLPATHTLGAR